MALSFQDQLAASCPRFVRSLTVQYSRTTPEMGAEYYLINTNYRLIKVACSTPNGVHNLKYIANMTFVKKYCCLFHLGHIFQWDEYDHFKAWMNMIVNQNPTFVDPYYRSSLAFTIAENLHEGIAQHPSWFLAIVGQVQGKTTVEIPRFTRSYLFAPKEAVAIVNSGDRRWYVKLKKGHLTEGWDQVAHAHNLHQNYCLLIASVGHLQFDLFVFNQDGCEVNYEWSTTLPIQEPNAPSGWNAEVAFSTANRTTALTACPPICFRACRHALRCAIVLKFADLESMEMPVQFQTSFQVQGRKEFNLVTRERTWTANYANGHLTGYGWTEFVNAHTLATGYVLILSPDANLNLHALIIGWNDHKRLYEWY
ncbi:hypothetical protein Vadar_000921 [Vaccinium darrowii]|uniref:Uncharacterized protein n=1 Tax=Vaccinium darrowii TaxID=229202 RepID=A0ACB7ZIP3_9ERIC|nr:hypothetical protein Vadar_000921 [Vaccinium darrowii]